jgi:hypothetical protein
MVCRVIDRVLDSFGAETEIERLPLYQTELSLLKSARFIWSGTSLRVGAWTSTMSSLVGTRFTCDLYKRIVGP